MACVHSLQHVERFSAADFTDDDAVRAHTQAVHKEFTLPDSAIAFKIWRAGFETRHVRLLKLQFRCILNCDNALFRANKEAQGVEQGCLTGAGSARDD